jgi:hypothetical protein
VIEAWHFVSKDRYTRFEPRVLIVPGHTLVHSGQLTLCESGFHASVRAIDALQYAPGPIICRVQLDGAMLDGGDKFVAKKRTVLWMTDATEALHEMACCSAEVALLIAGVDDQRCWNAIEAKRAWRRGEITDSELAAARDAAGAAARAAARDAAGAAARAAAGDEAWAAAWAAARAAARAAAWAAARAAARDEARAAAWAEARAAAGDEQNTLLEMLLNELPHE